MDTAALIEANDSFVENPRYDTERLFERYCACAGSIEEMLRVFESLPLEERNRMASRATLYRYEKQFNWKQRYDLIRKGVLDDLGKDVALNYERINQLADIALRGLVMRLHKALDEGDLSSFNAKTLQVLWTIQRTERGLPTNIQYREGHERIEQLSVTAHLEERPDLQELLKRMSPEMMDEFLNRAGITPPPKLLEKT